MSLVQPFILSAESNTHSHVILTRSAATLIGDLSTAAEELIATFYARRQAFERLQEMTAEAARRGWDLGASDPSTLDQSRRSEYKNLISEIRPGLEVAINGTSGVVRFVFAGEGSAIGPDWFKGIEYVPGGYGREGVLLPDLNKAASLPANVYIREIERSSQGGSSSISATSSEPDPLRPNRSRYDLGRL